MNYLIHKKKYFHIKIYCRILSCVLLLSISANMYGQQYGKESIDSLETLLGKPSIPDNELFLVYKNLTDAYVFIDVEKSLKYAWMGVQLAEKRNNPYQIAEFYNYTGSVFYYASQPDSALYYFKQSFEILKRRGENDKKNADSLQLELLNNIGIINYNQGQYVLALENYFKALDLAEKINAPDEIAAIYMYLANAYYAMANDRQAEAYYLKAEKLSRELNDSTGLAEAGQGLCNIYFNKKDYTTALKYGEESLRMLSASPNVPSYKLMTANQILTNVWLETPDYDKALEYAQKTVGYARQSNMPSFLASALYLLSNCYLKQGKFGESEKIAFEALATDSTVLDTNFKLYANIAIANIWLGKPEKSIAYFGKTTNTIRAYSNQNFQSSISEMEVKYETEKKEMQIATLKEEKRLMTWLSITGGCLLLLGLAAFFFLWRWTIQKRRLAESHIKQLEQEKQIVATQAVFDGEVQERSRLARDLHDGLGGKLTCMKIGLQELKQITSFDDAKEEQFKTVMDILDDSVREMRRVSHNLMPDTLSRLGLKPAVDDFCRSMSPIIVFNYYGEETRLNLKVEALIYRSIYELVNNALKYANASQIMVQIVQEAGNIAFTVQDDGCGFDTTAKTDGIGLQGIRSRVASFGGEIQIDSKVGEGTEINVELKIMN